MISCPVCECNYWEREERTWNRLAIDTEFRFELHEPIDGGELQTRPWQCMWGHAASDEISDKLNDLVGTYAKSNTNE